MKKREAIAYFRMVALILRVLWAYIRSDEIPKRDRYANMIITTLDRLEDELTASEKEK